MFQFREYRRYSIWKVGAVVFIASFGMFLLSYLLKISAGEPYPWKAYYEYLRNHVAGTIATTLFFYFALNEFHILLRERKSYQLFIFPILLCVIAVEAYNLVIDNYFPLDSNDPMPLATQFVGNFVVAAFNTVVALVIAYVNNLKEVRRKHRELEQQKLKLEVEKTNAELKFLKSQINPHFLHNTLNSFYARSLSLSRDLADGILTLSEMMRYALDEAVAADGKVLLKDEVEHVRNLIKLNQFRFRNNLHIELEVAGVLNGATVIPFVLITLVENIFKHGDLSDEQHPIKILIEVKQGKLRYYSHNKKKSGPKELSTGIGLDNIKKRLDLTYGSNYELNIRDEAEFYTTELIIHKL